MWPGIIEHYRNFLPIAAQDTVVTLQEGGTPLIPANRLLEGVPGIDPGGQIKLFLKVEGANPTGSFKDRGMTMAVSKAVSAGAEVVVCASTGNTAASAAAYAAAAGIRAALVLPAGGVAVGKLAQAIVHGAQLLPVTGNFDEALALVRELTERHRHLALVNSVNPYRLEGQKTIAFEIIEQLADQGAEPPATVLLPVGNAGNITAAWLGFNQWYEAGRIGSLPRMIGVQAAGSASMVLGADLDDPQTVATAIRIGRPASRQGAERAVAESGGSFLAVTDAEILAAQRRIAKEIGVFCEPASAASVAGLLQALHDPNLRSTFRGSVVCVLTGHGLKDPDAVGVDQLPTPVPARLDKLEKALTD